MPVSDPRVQAWLSGFVATGGCPPLTLENDAPALLPSACTANLTTVTFVARDATGATAQCTSSVTALAQCFAPPADVGDALRVGMHGDPHAASITARLDWSLDAGLPRAPGEHYHVLRGASPIALADIPGIEPWPALTLDESTPAFVALPGVHYYVILAASPCEDLSTD